MNAILLMIVAILSGWDERVAVADAVVTVAQQSQPDLPNDSPQGKPHRVKAEAEVADFVVNVWVTENCRYCDQQLIELKKPGKLKIAWVVRDHDFPESVDGVPSLTWNARGKEWRLKGAYSRPDIELSIEKTLRGEQ